MMDVLAAEKMTEDTAALSEFRAGLAEKKIAPFEIRTPDNNTHRFGDGEPAFSIILKDNEALSALASLDELRFASAYIHGRLDIKGSIWSMLWNRTVLHDIHPLHTLWRRLQPLLTGQQRTNQLAIADHYEYDNEFFLSFLDPTRCYSQAVFETDDEPLETAQRRKLDFIIDNCHLKPGDRVLDVGGGWGAFVEYAGQRGIEVTALTLARQSEKFLGQLIAERNLPCEVKYQDFYRHESPQPYDAIVILGVMEHLPDYRSVVKQFQHLLKPGGRIYLDASSNRMKHNKSTFISRYVFPGNHCFFCLHDFLAAVARTNLEVISIYNDRHSYYLTCREWAKKLESVQDMILQRWDEKLFRIFRLYLWGSAYSFYTHDNDAFRVVLERPAPMG
ncbi:MAG: class I SAM-dependent methyltransferase [Gammaproteobacteria bacterium]|nr:class I SAM-dependent methyltransferase [Gammaproteobacteria bacterium]MDH5653910.1 class I SAM-dependent methyltransferase [Gammaproteobacteria bacterium]